MYVPIQLYSAVLKQNLGLFGKLHLHEQQVRLVHKKKILRASFYCNKHPKRQVSNACSAYNGWWDGASSGSHPTPRDHRDMKYGYRQLSEAHPQGVPYSWRGHHRCIYAWCWGNVSRIYWSSPLLWWTDGSGVAIEKRGEQGGARQSLVASCPDMVEMLWNRNQIIVLSDRIWWQKAEPTLACVIMAWCLMVPNHYLNQYWQPFEIMLGLFHNRYISHQFLKLPWKWIIRYFIQILHRPMIKLLNAKYM